MRFEIRHDVYEISKRIKNIDKDYYVVYDTSKGKFEVHNTSQIDNTFCLTLPYEFLDERTLKYVVETRSENIDKILNQIEQDNEIRENEDKRKVLSDFNNLMEDKLKEN